MDSNEIQSSAESAPEKKGNGSSKPGKISTAADGTAKGVSTSTVEEKSLPKGVCKAVNNVNKYGVHCHHTPGLVPKKRIRPRDAQPPHTCPVEDEEPVNNDSEDDDEIQIPEPLDK